MRRLLSLFLCISVSACAVMPTAETDKRLAAFDEKIAADTVEQLARLYPPAKTQFSVVGSTPASFGMMLADKLRAKGYAIAESKAAAQSTVETGEIFAGDAFGAVYPQQALADIKPKPAFPPSVSTTNSAGIELRYVLDHSRTGEFSRIALKIGGSLLARAYVSDSGSIAPAGAWTYKE